MLRFLTWTVTTFKQNQHGINVRFL